MRDCISSTPLASSFPKPTKSQRPRIVLARGVHVTPPSSSSSKLLVIGCRGNGGVRIVKGTSRATPTRAARFGSEERYKFYGDSGLEGNDPFEFETNGEDLSTRNGIGPRNGTKRSDKGLDFLGLEGEMRGEGGSGEEDLVRIGGAGKDSGVDMEVEKGLELEKSGKVKVRGRQVMKRSSIVAKQVVSIESALSLGFVSQLWVNTTSWSVLLVEVRPTLLSGEADKFLLEDVNQVGDVVLVKDESVMDNDFRMAGLETLVGYKVVTPGRQNMGKVRGYTFNIHSGAVESLELDSFGISFIPSSLVSTYSLYVEDVLDVYSDTIVVHEAAASQVQRLTKGLWDTQKVRMSRDDVDEYSDFESDRGRSSQRSSDSQKPRRRKKKKKEIDEDWELPMDYL